MALLYVAAEDFEVKPFAAALTNLRKLKWPLQYAVEGVLHDRRIVLVADGAGPKLATRATEIAFRAFTVTGLTSSVIQAVITVGFCGALDPQLAVNNIVVGTEVLQRGEYQRFQCQTVSSPHPYASGVILSQDRIANDTLEKRELSALGTIAVEMEAAGVAAYAQRTGVPFACIKVVSDRVDESFPFDLNQMRTNEGRIARGKIGTYVLGHPTLLPKLWELKQRSKDAAGALGEFLVSCTISSEAERTLHE
jgi:adenosylhomocysteine nucleosidase